jgi:hypothetical protein
MDVEEAKNSVQVFSLESPEIGALKNSKKSLKQNKGEFSAQTDYNQLLDENDDNMMQAEENDQKF